MSIYQDHKPAGGSDGLFLDCLGCGKQFRTYPSVVKQGRGKYCGKQCSNKVTLFQAGDKHRLGGEKHPLWKGDNASYFAKHIWMKQHAGKASKCIECGATEGYFQWANVSGKYLRKFSDWKELCIRCHQRYDNSHVKAWETRRKNVNLSNA